MKILEGEQLSLVYKDYVVFTHSEKAPFVYANIWKSKIKRFLGKFEEKGRIVKSIPLSQYKIVENTDKSVIILFSNDTYSITLSIKESEDFLSISFSSNNDCGFSFSLPGYEDEGIFGGGEQYRKINLKGEHVENLVSEHIKVGPIAKKILFKGLYRPVNHSKINSYSPMCTFVSSKLYAIRFKVSSYGIADFSCPNRSIFSFQSCPTSLTFIKESSYTDISLKLALDIKNSQYLPSWCMEGMILGIQGGTEKVVSKAKRMLEAGAKVCGVWCQDWSGQYVTAAGKQVYWNWKVDSNCYPNLSNTIKEFQTLGIHFLAYINPYLIVDGPIYNYCKEHAFLVKKVDGSIYHIKSTTFDAGMMDLTNPGMVNYLKETIIKNNMLELGIEGYMADFGEYLPFDAVLYDGNAKELHNEWPVIWARINREAIEESHLTDKVFFFSRSGYDGAQSYAPIMWNGDQHTDFSLDYGLPCVIPASINLGFSGLSAIHSDVGGFISFGPLKRDSELFIRWMEMNTFSLLMRSHETIRPEANCQYDSPHVIEHFIKLSNIHALLKPYIEKVLIDARKGIPSIKPDFYLNSDFTTHKEPYSYFFGDDIFVCPIIKKGQSSRKLYLPEGEWVHLFTKEKFNSGEHLVEAPLGCPPVFYRASSIFKELFESLPTK